MIRKRVNYATFFAPCLIEALACFVTGSLDGALTFCSFGNWAASFCRPARARVLSPPNGEESSCHGRKRIDDCLAAVIAALVLFKDYCDVWTGYKLAM
jgi:hypothetical protein